MLHAIISFGHSVVCSITFLEFHTMVKNKFAQIYVLNVSITQIK